MMKSARWNTSAKPAVVLRSVHFAAPYVDIASCIQWILFTGIQVSIVWMSCGV